MTARVVIAGSIPTDGRCEAARSHKAVQGGKHADKLEAGP